MMLVCSTPGCDTVLRDRIDATRNVRPMIEHSADGTLVIVCPTCRARQTLSQLLHTTIPRRCPHCDARLYEFAGGCCAVEPHTGRLARTRSLTQCPQCAGDLPLIRMTAKVGW